MQIPQKSAMALVLLVGACDNASEDPCADVTRNGSLVAPSHPQAHGDEAEECEEGPVGEPTDSLCPTDSTLTYENFGQAFMTDYCVRCHASTLDGDARQGAPLYHDFDSLSGILAVADHIDQKAASGPAATNEDMPPAGVVPTLEERQKLGQWLACELAAM